MAVVVEIGDDGLARGIEQILVPVRRPSGTVAASPAGRSAANGRNQGM